MKKLIAFLISIVLLSFGELKAQETPNANIHKDLYAEITLEECTKMSAKSFDAKSVAVRGYTKACLELFAKDFVDLTGDFHSEYGSTFDAQIVDILPSDHNPGGDTGTPPGTNPDPDPQPDPEPDTEPNNAACEDLSNHGPANPHLFAVTSNNTIAGDLLALSTPEYRIEGLTGWKKMSKMGKVVPYGELNHYIFSEITDSSPRKVWLRTKPGCYEYGDVRTQQPIFNTLEQWSTLPFRLQDLRPTDLGVNFFVNSELEHKSDINGIAVYNIWGDSWIGGFQARINGSRIINFNKYEFPLFRERNNQNLMSADYFNTSKDFILDVSKDGFVTGERYTVYRNYQGGHWTTVTTLTRHDGRVTVNCQGINWETNQKLVSNSNGKTFWTKGHFGNLFELGYLSDGDYSFQLQTKEGFVVNPNVVIKVKRP